MFGVLGSSPSGSLLHEILQANATPSPMVVDTHAHACIVFSMSAPADIFYEKAFRARSLRCSLRLLCCH
jgi:hypothetical protein